MARAVILVLFAASTTCGQTAISVNVGGQYPFSAEYAGLEFFRLDYWPVGVTGAINCDVELQSWLRLLPGLEYTLYPIKSNVSFHGAYSANLSPPSGSGDAFQRLLLRLECRIVSPATSGTLRPFVEMDGAYAFERIGEISYSTPGGGEEEIVISRIDRRGWVFGLGLGSELWLSRRFRIEPSLRYHMDVDRRFYGLFTFSIVYTLDV